jgi:hypothetical protein
VPSKFPIDESAVVYAQGDEPEAPAMEVEALEGMMRDLRLPKEICFGKSQRGKSKKFEKHKEPPINRMDA